MALQPSELSALHDDVDLDRDRVLVERCQAGDSSAFGELYSRYYARVYRFCFRRLHDHEEAEDVAQDAFARAWRALPSFAGERRFYPWLTVIADNRCRDIQRRRVRSTPTADVDLAAKQAAEPISADTPEDVLIASVEGALAVQALERLSPRHRQVLSMREGSGWTYQEIATHEGVEIRTIESLIWRARQALKREYASIAKVNGVIGGIAVGRWGALRRVGGSIGRRMHPVSALVGSTGGARGLATAMAFTSLAVVAAAVPSSSQPDHHSVAVVAPAGQATAVQSGLERGWGNSSSPIAPRSSIPATPSAGPTASDQTMSNQTIAAPPSTDGEASTSAPAGLGVPDTTPASQGLGQLPSAPIPGPTNTVILPPGASTLTVPGLPDAPALLAGNPLTNLPDTIASTLSGLPSTPIPGLLGGQ